MLAALAPIFPVMVSIVGAPAFGQSAPPAPNPLLDEQLRYRQVLGAYQRMPERPRPPDANKPRGVYVRLVDQSRKRHDGLYFRFALGIGFAHEHVTSSSSLPSINTFSFFPKPLDASGGFGVFHVRRGDQGDH